MLGPLLALDLHLSTTCRPRRGPSTMSRRTAHPFIVCDVLVTSSVHRCLARARRWLVPATAHGAPMSGRARHSMLAIVSVRRHSGHRQSGVLPPPGILVLLQTEPKFVRLDAPDCAPQPLAHPALGRQVLDQLERHVVLLPTLRAEGHGGMSRCEKQDGDCGEEEVMVKDLYAPVDDTVVVEVRQIPNGLLCQVDDLLSKVIVLRYAGRGVQHWRIQPDTDLTPTSVRDKLPGYQKIDNKRCVT